MPLARHSVKINARESPLSQFGGAPLEVIKRYVANQKNV
jgi:hypothetical protein